jgi:uncharacterized protein (TIGR00725 family)
MSANDLQRALAGRRAVTIFGSSEPRPGEPSYQEAHRAGVLLAEAGLAVVNGGYGGVMDASSRGAREAGGPAIGVTVAGFLGRGGGNRWLSHEICEPDLYRRTRTLVELACGYLVLPGKAGTLAELGFLWALRRGRLLGDRPVVLAGPSWEDVVHTLREKGLLDPATLKGTWLAPTVDGAVRRLLENLP